MVLEDVASELWAGACFWAVRSKSGLTLYPHRSLFGLYSHSNMAPFPLPDEETESGKLMFLQDMFECTAQPYPVMASSH